MRLVDLRKAKGLTQEQLGSLLGLNGSTITTYEKGIRTPRWPTICKISEIFGVTIDELEFGEQVESDKPDTA